MFLQVIFWESESMQANQFRKTLQSVLSGHRGIPQSLRRRRVKTASAAASYNEPLEPRLLLFANPIHKALTIDALPFIKDEVIADINDEHTFQEVAGLLDQDEHFDGNHFEGAAAEINTAYNTILDEADPESFDSGDIPDKFGQLLHAVQDFYAHSNWVNLGQTTLIERGTGLWDALLPYSIHDGAMLIEGEDETPTVPGLGTATLRRTGGSGGFPGFGVEVDFGGGTIFKGVVSGTFGPDHSPDNVAIGHYDPVFGSDRGLNKDDPSRALHTEARSLAVSQTIQEFRRLGALIDSRYGDEGVCKLLEEWVKPDDVSQKQAREILGVGAPIDLVFVIDTTGSMSDDIAAVKAAATEIIDKLKEESPCFRVGIVLYKDAGDVYVTQTALAFTNDADVANAAIQSISVSGGGDFPEAVFAALDHAILNLDGLGSWRGGAVAGVGGIPKKIILMGDAPPHDPDLATGATAASVAQHAFDADPVDIFPIVIGNDSSAVASFQAIADANRGQLFVAQTAENVVNAILEAIDVIGGGGTGVIQGRKWLDTNQNGIQNSGEEWLNGWTVELVNSTGGVVATATTADIDLDGNGTIDSTLERGVYRFTGVGNDEYEVREVIPAGWAQSFPISPIETLIYSLDVTNNFRTTANNFQDWAGLNERWLMSNNGWHYVTPAGGLFKWLSGRGETLQAQLVAKLNPTFYNDLNLLASPAAPQTHQVTITTGSQVTGIDFGNYGASTIEGQKWEDSDRDGIRDSGERFLNGWQFQLINSDTGAVVKTTTTQSLDLNLDGWIDPETEVGVYLFEGVTPGKYEVREVLKTGWIQSTPTQDLLTLARSLDTSRDFQTSNGSFLNWGNLSEKWLLGNDGWYFITPDGALSKWNLSPRTALTGTKVAQLSPWFYQQLSRLTNAADPADSLIDVTDEIHVTGLNVGNYRANGANGLLINGNADPRLVPGNVRVWVSGADIRVAGDQFDNQVALFVDWRHNLIAVGLQGTTINGQTGPVVLLQNAWTVPGSVNADLGSGHDLIALQGFKTGRNVWVNAGAGIDSILALNMQVGGNFDVISGWGAGNVGISNSSIANNLTIWGSEGRDNVILDKVVVSNFTSINLGAGGDRLLTRGSIFHDDTRINLSYGDDVLVALGTNDFKRLLFIDGSLGTDATFANSVTAGQKIVWGVESNTIPNVEVLLDQILSELAVLGLDASLLQ